MTFLGNVIRLKGITQKGKNRVREHGDTWVVTAETDHILFKPNDPGPFLFISPSGCDQNHKAARWIKSFNDPDFVILTTG